MKVGTRTKTHEGLAAMQMLALIVFIGYLIEALPARRFIGVYRVLSSFTRCV